MEEENKEYKFKINDRVLCYHGPLIYEAKILQTKWEENEPHYYVHYKGWTKNWDEWVEETRVLPWSDENVKMQLRLKEFYMIKQNAAQQNEESSLGKRRRDTKNSSFATDKVSIFNQASIKLDIPEILKVQLVDDWENVTKNQQLVSLPRETSINQIFILYKKFKKEKEGNKELNQDLLEEVVHGLRIYFNKALGTMLLYRFERLQYADIMRQYPKKELVDLYGAEHLLRLFVQMPSLIAQTNMDPEAIHVLIDYLTDILYFMQKERKNIFQQEYDNATPSYVSLAQNS
ncbi:MRG-domain-containing protein [Backusella circina FSU 941]|nr:MRG-domain-containing protein [Backusella circina FSU 941]